MMRLGKVLLRRVMELLRGMIDIFMDEERGNLRWARWAVREGVKY